MARDPELWDTHDFWDVYEPISTHQLEAMTPAARAERSADYQAYRARRASKHQSQQVDALDPMGWKRAFERAVPGIADQRRKRG